MARKPYPTIRTHLRAAYRSGLEKAVALALSTAQVPFEFETVKVPYLQPEKHRRYTPDFILENGVVVETKGLFAQEDRQKHLWVKEQHPNLDIRFVFSSPSSRLKKGSPTTYAMWCDKHGFKWAKRSIPESWLTEERQPASWEALEALRG